MSKISQQWLGHFLDTCQLRDWHPCPSGLSQFEPGKIHSKFSDIFGQTSQEGNKKRQSWHKNMFALLCPHFCYQMCTGAPNVRPPKKKLITLDEVRDTFCPDSCLTSYIFPFLSNILLCKYQLNWRSFKVGFWTNTASAPHTYCCLSQEECFRFFERPPTHRRPIWKLERPNWERWLQRGRTGSLLKMNVRSLSNSFSSFPSNFLRFFIQCWVPPEDERSVLVQLMLVQLIFVLLSDFKQNLSNFWHEPPPQPVCRRFSIQTILFQPFLSFSSSLQ